MDLERTGELDQVGHPEVGAAALDVDQPSLGPPDQAGQHRLLHVPLPPTCPDALADRELQGHVGAVPDVGQLEHVEGDAEGLGKGAGIALPRGGGTALPGGHGARGDAHPTCDLFLGEAPLPAELRKLPHAGEDISAAVQSTHYMKFRVDDFMQHL